MTPRRRPRPRHWRWRLAGGLAAVGLAAGCASTTLDGARHQYYQGRVDQAAASLAGITPDDRDQILYLMERGMVLQKAGAYDESATLFIDAAHRIEAFEAYSITRGSASWLINDTVYRFRGKPYERTLLHAFTALNFFALGQWDSAAVEARRILDTLDPETKGDYPDDPYSRYIAGFAFEMIQDRSSAALQYRYAAEQAEGAAIDPDTGWLGPPPGEPAEPSLSNELVCFFLTGRAAPAGDSYGPVANLSACPQYAELYAGDRYLGRTHTLTDTTYLASLSEKEDALRKTAKTAARIMIKETIADALEEETNDAMGDLARLVLIGLLEQPDLRAWETLPRWLQVARVACPANLKSINLIVRYRGGRESARRTITGPISRNGKIYVTFYRDLPEL